MNTERYHHGDLRNALLACALRRIEAEGTTAFSLRAAAAEIGVSPAAAYRHFDSKDALLAELAADGFEALSAEMRAAVDSALAGAGTAQVRAGDALEASGLSYLSFAARNPTRFRLMFGARNERYRSMALELRASRGGDSSHEILREAIDALASQAPGHVRDVEAASGIAWSAVHGLAMLALDGYVEIAQPAYDVLCRQLVTTLRKGLTAT
ncbi:MAG: TetR/AcrR family transcriptional regulator [Burkholderiaceae bacterium]